MPFIPVTNTIGVELIFEWDGQVVENTLYFEFDGAPTLGDVGTFIGELNTLVQTDLLPLLSNTLALVRIVAKLLTTIDGFQHILNVSPPATGSGGDRPVPNNSTYAIQFKSALSGRSFSGRNYIAGILEEDVTSNSVTGALRTGLLAFYTAVGALAASNNFTHVVVSRYSGVDGDGKPIPRAAGVTTPVTTYTTADLTVDSQRRRLPGRGT